MDKEYIDSPQYWVRQHIIGKAYNVDKYTLNRFIEALEWQITEYEQLQKRFDKSVATLRRVEQLFRLMLVPPMEEPKSAHYFESLWNRDKRDAKYGIDEIQQFLRSMDKEN